MLDERKLTVDREKLIEKVKENFEKHKITYQESVNNYADATKACIKNLQADIRKDPRNFSHLHAFKNLEKPHNYIEEYKKILDMLNACVDSTVELSFDQFEQWYRDNWGWKHHFINNSNTLAGLKNK